jgi:hypothetical protein
LLIVESEVHSGISYAGGSDRWRPEERLIDWSVNQFSGASGPIAPSVRKTALAMPSLPSPPSPLPPSLWSDGARRVAAAIALLAVAAIGFGIGYIVFDDSGSDEGPPAPTAVVINPAQQPSSAETGGFPEFATRNTTRIGGADPTADAASVALATYPTQGGVGSTGAATIVPADSWQLSLAAAPLTADPISTPILLSGADEVPQPTTAALTALSPQGLDKAGGAQAFAVGDVAVPGGLQTITFDGSDPADVADQVDIERAKITGIKDPPHLLVVSSSDAGLAMPAAAWAARSGDPILFADGDEVPDGTMSVIKRHPNAPVFVLGPSSAISDVALKKLGSATRVGADDPVENAIEFAKFTSGSFGWNINDPGHGFAIASTGRPLDAAAAAPLASSGGSPGPLLLTDDPATVPPALQSFLSDTQPGFEDDPTRAVFNHVWIIGNSNAISVPFQVQVDQLTKLAPVSGAKVPPDVTLPGAGTTTTPEIDPGVLDELGQSTTTPDTTTTPGGGDGSSGNGSRGQP